MSSTCGRHTVTTTNLKSSGCNQLVRHFSDWKRRNGLAPNVLEFLSIQPAWFAFPKIARAEKGCRVTCLILWCPSSWRHWYRYFAALLHDVTDTDTLPPFFMKSLIQILCRPSSWLHWYRYFAALLHGVTDIDSWHKMAAPVNVFYDFETSISGVKHQVTYLLDFKQTGPEIERKETCV